uniref:Uncharacterized protein n=1 Tax=Arundo donax TaxID=35708 RepID=A0A0A9H7Q7_ARUDO
MPRQSPFPNLFNPSRNFLCSSSVHASPRFLCGRSCSPSEP